MRLINLERIMLVQSISSHEMGNILFPLNQHPTAALSRVLAGEGVLDEGQINRLAVHLQCLPADLFDWKMRSQGNLVTFTSGTFKVILNTDSFVTTVYDKETLKHEMFMASKTITLKEFLYQINKITDGSSY